MNTMQKYNCARVLKIIFYLLGFPLLLLFVAKDSMVFFDEEAFAETAKAGITGVFLLWLGFSAIQVGLYLVMKKQQALRTVILAIIAVALMLAPVAGLNNASSKKIEDVQAKYADKSAVVVKDYYQQTQWFNTLSVDKPGEVDRLNANITEFIRVYGLERFYPEIYRARTQLNTVPYFVTFDGERYDVVDEDGGKIFDKIQHLSPYAYNPNGLLYDGYVFGVKNAVELLIEYNEYKAVGNTTRPVGKLDTVTGGTISVTEAMQNKYKIRIDTLKEDGKHSYSYATYNETKHVTASPAEGQMVFDGNLYEVLTIDEALNKAIETAESSEAWTAYTTTETFGTDNAGNALNYADLKAQADEIVLTEKRLNAVLGTVFEYIGKSQGLNSLFDGLHGVDLIALLGGAGIAIGEAELGEILAGLRYPAYYLLGDIIKLDTAEKLSEYDAWLLDPDGDATTTKTMADYEEDGIDKIAGLTFLLGGLQPILPILGGLLTGTVVDLVKGLLPIDLSLLGLTDEKLNGLVTPLLNAALDPATGIDLSALTPEAVNALLMGILGELSYYQHPLLKMSWDSQFMADSDKALVTDNGTEIDLSRYAWVKYTCEKWGITNGCALATVEGGLLTGKTLGNGTSPDDAFTLDELYQMEADLSYMPDQYPLYAARRYMALWSGLLALSVFFSAYFFKKEQTLLYKITLDGGEF